MKILNNIGKAVLIGILILIIILVSPFLVPLIAVNYFADRSFKKKYQDYLISIDGTKFFCYNNKKRSQEFIEKNILPFLSSGIDVIFMNGRIPISNYNEKYISKLLYSITEKKGFPYLIKVSNGELIETSINSELYNTLNQNKEISSLINKINIFFAVI